MGQVHDKRYWQRIAERRKEEIERLRDVVEGYEDGQSGIYAMIALGYTMVYGIAKLLNFAHGDIIMVGGYVIFKERLTRSQLIGFGIGCAAILLIGLF